MDVIIYYRFKLFAFTKILKCLYVRLHKKTLLMPMVFLLLVQETHGYFYKQQTLKVYL